MTSIFKIARQTIPSTVADLISSGLKLVTETDMTVNHISGSA